VFPPHLAAHHAGGITTVANGDVCGVVHQLGYLLPVVFVGWREVDGTEPALGVAAGMQLEAVVPALPVPAKGGHTFGYLMPVGSHQAADFQHSAVHEAERSSAI
jgi:hypothetical protein